MSNNSLVQLQEISKVYFQHKQQVIALKKINLTIKKGEFVAISGPSGSGKTTLCNIIGLLDKASSGNLQLKGEKILNQADAQLSEIRSRVIGFIFQSFNLLPVLSLLENVIFPLQIQGVSSNKAKAKALPLLEFLGLQSHLHHRPNQLSGGQQQRAAIAREIGRAHV